MFLNPSEQPPKLPRLTPPSPSQECEGCPWSSMPWWSSFSSSAAFSSSGGLHLDCDNSRHLDGGNA